MFLFFFGTIQEKCKKNNVNLCVSYSSLMNTFGLNKNWSLVLHHCYSNCVEDRRWTDAKKESDNSIRQNRCHVPTSLSSNPQAPSGHRACGKRRKWQYAPWSLLSVGESSCRRKNLTSCFRGPHFCRCSYIMCSKGIARSKETAVGKTEEKKRLFHSNLNEAF